MTWPTQYYFHSLFSWDFCLVLYERLRWYRRTQILGVVYNRKISKGPFIDPSPLSLDSLVALFGVSVMCRVQCAPQKLVVFFRFSLYCWTCFFRDEKYCIHEKSLLFCVFVCIYKMFTVFTWKACCCVRIPFLASLS